MKCTSCDKRRVLYKLSDRKILCLPCLKLACPNSWQLRVSEYRQRNPFRPGARVLCTWDYESNSQKLGKTIFEGRITAGQYYIIKRFTDFSYLAIPDIIEVRGNKGKFPCYCFKPAGQPVKE